MATAATDRYDRTVSIGRIFSRAFGTLASNPVATLGIAFLFGALPSFLLIYLMASVGVQAVEYLGTAATIGVAIFSAVTAILLSMITQGALVRATVAFSEGRKASLGESAMAGLSVALPLFLLGILSALGVGLGLVLLLVPGVILYVMWSVAAPALVEERLGPIEAFGRSRYLTSGARWKIFGLILVILVVYLMFSAVVEVLSAMTYGGNADLSSNFMTGVPLGYLATTVISGTISSAVWGVVLTSLYVELREWKDGPRTEALADIFG
ncbi:MAG TPA: hypothetical protein VE053_01880 [Allosphingosinicella sp.]|nr:hypothetical protein [Allosphingosinicella sp.]